jgi:hypothetical protein
MSGQSEGNSVSRENASAAQPCGVVDPKHAWKLHVREPRDPVAIRSREAADRRGKAMSDKTHMHGSGESYSAIVPAKRPNEGRGGPQEVVEGRALTEENTEQSNPNRTPSRGNGSSGLDRVRQAAKGELCIRTRRYASRRNTQQSGPISEVRTVCVSSASTDLCGGCWAASIPTATGGAQGAALHCSRIRGRILETEY